MRICLVRSSTDPPILPPIGIAYLTSVLRQKRFNVKAIDFQTSKHRSDLDRKLNGRKLILDKKFDITNLNKTETRKFLELINLWCEDTLKIDPEIVGFTVTWPNLELSLLLAKELKKKRKDIVTVFGGPQCSREVSGGIIPRRGVVDVVVHGEGEEVILDIAKNYQNSSTIDFIKGATILKDGKPKYCGERAPIQNLDALPFPDFTDFELQKYSDGLPINTCRGCYRSCSFCYHIVFWKEYRERSPRSVVNELKHDIKKYEIRKFFFGDSEINSKPNPSRLEKMCDLIIESELEITWGADAIFGNLGSSLLAKMYRAGCRTLDFRAGSFSSHILKDMNKNFTAKQIHDTLKLVKENKIIPTPHLTIGFPTETKLDFMEELLFYWMSFDREIYVNLEIVPMNVYVGTDVFSNPQKYGVKINEDYYQDRLRFKLLFSSWFSENVRPPELLFRTTLFSYLHDELRARTDRKKVRPGILTVMAAIDELLKSTYELRTRKSKLRRTETMTKIYSEILLLWSFSLIKKQDFRQMIAQKFPSKQYVYDLLSNKV